jgi:hypothetical protein
VLLKTPGEFNSGAHLRVFIAHLSQLTNRTAGHIETDPAPKQSADYALNVVIPAQGLQFGIKKRPQAIAVA